MKKLFFLAATAMLFAAWTSDELALQEENGVAGTQSEAVGFDVYVPAATQTRAGLEGTMTTNRIQRAEGDGGGFGVYAFLTEDADADDGLSNTTAYTPAATHAPNFMYNEKILWNTTNLGWYYSPLKYWPNETENDSQSSPATMENATSPIHLDRLTFFAYAPYVSVGSGTEGIVKLSDINGDLDTGGDITDPTVKYVSTTTTADVDPNKYVDLLWGVAPSGGLSYTAVNGTTVSIAEGKPLIDMIKPDVNTSMKFLFNHSLARFGINVVAAVDQVAPGGKLDENTKITVNKLKITGPFGITGNLSLNNGENAGIANWTKIQSTTVNGSTANMGSSDQSITVAANETNNAIAPHLRYTTPHNAPVVQPVVGVTTAKQDLLAGSTKWFNKLAAVPTYDFAKQYYSDANGTKAVAKYTASTPLEINGTFGFGYTLADGIYTKRASDLNAPAYPAVSYTQLYFVTATEYTIPSDDTKPGTLPTGAKVYTIDAETHDGTTAAKAPTFSYNSAFTAGTWTGAISGKKVYTLSAVALTPAQQFAYSGDIYAAERNYLYVIPTNNISKNAAAVSNRDALRTITLEIEYYITTEDAKLQAKRAQTKNVITKTVVLPSLDNGKSYMLNLVLGLTSVKVEAEVEDWKVVNVQADLPQNTAE